VIAPVLAKLAIVYGTWVEWRPSMRKRVIETLQKILGPEVDVDDIRLELESLKRLEIVVALENEFGAHIPEDAPLARITSSVDSIVAYLRKLC
jgi:acyl carrier protein